MKADIDILLQADVRAGGFCYWFNADKQFYGDHRGMKEQIVAIILGWAEPVELE